jgi:hypothetical protein
LDALSGGNGGDDWQLIPRLGEEPSPERILKIVESVAGSYKLEMTIRYAKLQEYIDCGIAGAGAGVFLFGSIVIISAVAGGTFTLSAFLGAAAVGAVVGGVLGAASAPIAYVSIYQSEYPIFTSRKSTC